MRSSEIVLLGLVLVVSLFVFLTNPILGVPGCDSSIFIYVARRMIEGQTPYLDVFDQKGMLIYAIDAISWQLGGVMGIWVADVLAFVIALALMTRIIRIAPVALVVWIALYHFVACGGNMPEMWIVVFSAVAYVLAVNAKADEAWKWMVMGVCTAQILMLKLNMIAIVAPVGIFWILRGGSIKSALFVVAGHVIGLSPYAAYFSLKGAWGALWEVYVQYNAQYALHGGWIPSITRAFYPVAVLWGVNLWMILRGRGQLAWVNFAYLTVAWGLVLISGGSVRYYGPVLPACIVPLAFGFDAIRDAWPRMYRVGSLCVMMLVLVAIVGVATVRNHAAKAIRGQYEELRSVKNEIADLKSVTVLGCDCHVYQVLDAVCPGRFPFQGTVAQCSEHYRRIMLADIEAEKSQYIILPKGVLNVEGSLGVKWAKDPIEKHYHLVAHSSMYEILERGQEK